MNKHPKWKSNCFITDGGLAYNVDRAKPQDLLDDVLCQMIFGSAPSNLEDRIAMLRACRRATFAADRVLSNLCNYARNNEFHHSRWGLKKL